MPLIYLSLVYRRELDWGKVGVEMLNPNPDFE